MKLEVYDQFEFGEWESESLLVVASERKGLRGADFRVKNIQSFFQLTESLSNFNQWQSGGWEQALRVALSNECEAAFKPHQVCKEVANLDINPDQKVYLVHSEWNLVDFLWETHHCFYRVMWCMSA